MCFSCADLDPRFASTLVYIIVTAVDTRQTSSHRNRAFYGKLNYL